MTTFLPLSDASLTVDKPLGQSIVRAGLRDNQQAVIEGDPSVPTGNRIQPRSIDSPYFLAQRTTSYTDPGFTADWKMPFNTETYDPDSLYDAVTNYRFTPNKAGLYLVTVYVFTTAGTSQPTTNMPPYVNAIIKKNGVEFLRGYSGQTLNDVSLVSSTFYGTGRYMSSLVTAIVQMNGSTDFLEGWAGDGLTGAGHGPFQGYFHAVGLCAI